ncbi:hypothetical protein [Streptomyces sp. NPDC056188]|uniref:hypothetical protein n=1 Tax=Streptomyces sp. NPDC056188 TaxID=3345740 RepID=UPI0035DFA707
MSGTPGNGGGVRRLLSCLGVVVVVLAVLAGGVVWLLRDELFHPFGDARACVGSDAKLPGVISAGGAPIPAGASDIHYLTRNGRAEVAFVSGRIPDYLDRAGILPEDKPLFDRKYGEKVDDGIARPDDLCGTPLREPLWLYHSTTDDGADVSVLVERSPTVNDALRFPARAVITYNFP